MKRSLFLFCAAFAISNVIQALDIKTLDGTTYKNVTVTNVLPNSIDIFYTRKDGTPVLRGIKFTNLPEDIRKKYKYSPQRAKVFEKNCQEYQKKRFDKMMALEKRNQALYKKQQKLFDEADEVAALIYARRQNIYIHVVRPVDGGVIGYASSAYNTLTSGNYGKYFVRGISGSNGQKFKVVIYPTGKTISFEDGTFPVYDTSLERVTIAWMDNFKNLTVPSTTAPVKKQKK
jgi:hypothetical protein